MPLDGCIEDFVKPAAPDLTKPSLEALAWVLENGLWPGDHKWDFNIRLTRRLAECGTAGCALGIADLTWGRRLASYQPFEEGLGEAWSTIFTVGRDDRTVTPAVVAGRIRDYLDGRPIRYLVEGDRS